MLYNSEILLLIRFLKEKHILSELLREVRYQRCRKINNISDLQKLSFDVLDDFNDINCVINKCLCWHDTILGYYFWSDINKKLIDFFSEYKQLNTKMKNYDIYYCFNTK